LKIKTLFWFSTSVENTVKKDLNLILNSNYKFIGLLVSSTCLWTFFFEISDSEK